jgi:hypothetical protein
MIGEDVIEKHVFPAPRKPEIRSPGSLVIVHGYPSNDNEISLSLREHPVKALTETGSFFWAGIVDSRKSSGYYTILLSINGN